MHKTKNRGVLLLFLTLILVISGCGFKGEDATNEIDPPNDQNYVEEGESLDEDANTEENDATSSEEEGTAAQTSDTIKTQLYLFDKNGLVVPQVLQLPKTQSVAKQALQYLVKDGPISNVIPNGMQAVLPAGTEVTGVNIEQGTATVNFSEEFKEYAAEDEQRILEAITFTLTQFENVNNVKIWINGVNQTVMPVNNTPVGEGLSRANGINLEHGNIVDVTNSETVTLYFLAQTDDLETYYVPVTRRINQTDDLVTATIEELISGPSLESNLLTNFRTGVELLTSPTIEENVATLNFNESILEDMESKMISDEVLNSIVLSLTENTNVESVTLEVNGQSEVVKASGESLTEPVMRPEMVNTVGF
jgi:germination protein M